MAREKTTLTIDKKKLERARRLTGASSGSEAVAARAGALWLQFGVISVEGAELARSGGLRVVMDRCLKVEHARHLGRMHWLGFNTWQVTARRAWDA